MVGRTSLPAASSQTGPQAAALPLFALLSKVPERVRDVALVALLFGNALTDVHAATLGETFQSATVNPRWSVGALVLVVAAETAPLLFMRRAPMAVLVVLCSMLLVHAALDMPINDTWLHPSIALYVVTARYPRKPAQIAAVGSLGFVLLMLLLLGGRHLFWSASIFVISTLAAYALGSALRRAEDYSTVLAERAELLERQAVLEAQEAVMQERARIAREIHDALGHTLNVVVLQAGAARLTATDQEAPVTGTLEAIESVGREGLAEVDRMLGLLGETAPRDRTPLPSLDEVRQLVARTREVGARVDLDVVGEPPDIPRSLQLAIVRIVQESLTNALKHAPGSAVTVELRYAPNRVDISVVDDGLSRVPVPAPALAETRGGGRGLLGMRERVTLFGGELLAGPRPSGGFEVRATLPVPETP